MNTFGKLINGNTRTTTTKKPYISTFRRHHEIILPGCPKTSGIQKLFRGFKAKAFKVLNRNLNKRFGFLNFSFPVSMELSTLIESI